MLFANQIKLWHVGVLLLVYFPLLAACSNVVTPLSWLYWGGSQLFWLIPTEVKILCAGIFAIVVVVYIIVGFFYALWHFDWFRSFVISFIAEWFRIGSVRPFNLAVSSTLSRISEDVYRVSIHRCDSPKCRYMVHICDLERNDDSEYGFCESASVRIASPSGVYLVDSYSILEEQEFRYSRLCQGFPIFEANGKYTLEVRKSLYLRSHRMHPMSWLFYHCCVYNPEVVRVDPFLLKIMADVKFEAQCTEFNFANKIRAALSNNKTVAKTVVDMYHADIAMLYREFLVVEGGGLSQGVYNGVLYWPIETCFDEDDNIDIAEGRVSKYERYHRGAFVTGNSSEEMRSRCFVVKVEEVEKEEAPESSVTVKEALVVNEEDDRKVEEIYVTTVESQPPPLLAKYNKRTSSEYVHTRVDSIHQVEAPFRVERLQGALLLPSITGLETDEVDLLHDPEPEEVKLQSITVVPKGSKSFSAKPGRRMVQYGLVFGAEGLVYSKCEKTNIQCYAKRIDKLVPEPTRKIDVCGKSLSIGIEDFDFNDQLDYVPASYVSKDEVFRDMTWIDDKKVKMNAQQKARLIRILNNIQTDAEYSWKTKDKIQIKYFIKPDELLVKAKPRVITFIPTVVWIRIVLLLDEFLGTIKRDDNPLRVMQFNVLNKNVDIYWASGMDQSTLSKAATEAQQNFESDGTLYFFVCGDDNTSHNFSVDFSSYDCTQTEYFFRIQAALFASRFRSNDQAKISKIIDEMFKMHKGNREDMYNYYKTNKVTLPSGAPWTLVLNTLGTIVYCLLWVYTCEMSRTDVTHRGAESCAIMEKYMPTTLACLGLTATFNPNRCEGNLAGVEFLKGVFVPYVVNQVSKLYWIPVDGRIFKVGKVIHNNDKTMFTAKQLYDRIVGIANGYASFNLGPIMSAFVSVWSNNATVVVSEYTVGGKAHWDDFEEASVIPGFWEEFYAERYNISASELQLMIKHVISNGRSFAKFTGGGWSRLVQADYLGTNY